MPATRYESYFLSNDVSEYDLQKLFSGYGNVRSIRVSRGSVNSEYSG